MVVINYIDWTSTLDVSISVLQNICFTNYLMKNVTIMFLPTLSLDKKKMEYWRKCYDYVFDENRRETDKDKLMKISLFFTVNISLVLSKIIICP